LWPVRLMDTRDVPSVWKKLHFATDEGWRTIGYLRIYVRTDARTDVGTYRYLHTYRHTYLEGFGWSRLQKRVLHNILQSSWPHHHVWGFRCAGAGVVFFSSADRLRKAKGCRRRTSRHAAASCDRTASLKDSSIHAP